MSSFISRYSSNIDHSWNKVNIIDMADSFREISDNLDITSDNREIIRSNMDHLEKIKFAFLNDDELDVFAVEMNAYAPY